MKTYVLTISERFPKRHLKKGEPTYFADSILSRTKLHTIRANYPLWKNRIEAIKEGKAILSIRYWSGKPYGSKQVEICQLDKESGVGIQEIAFLNWDINRSIVGWDKEPDLSEISKNDGLSTGDFIEWFSHYDLSQPMVIIHFTNFRY